VSAMPPPAPAAATRQNDDVSSLPPPMPPPPPAHPKGHADDWHWDRVKRVAEHWYRPLVKSESWLALAYLLAGMMTGIVFFVVTMIVGWSTIGLMFAGIGFLLVGVFFRVVDRLATAERKLARIVGAEIPARSMPPIKGLGLGAALVTDRWRQVAFLCANIVIGIALFTWGAFLYSFVIQILTGDGSFAGLSLLGWNPLATVITLALAGFAAGAAPRVAIFLAHLKVQITSWFLAPDRLAAAERRVSTLAVQRHDILDAVASERRRIERNLHDGVQQQLVAIGLDLGMAEHHLDSDQERARQLIVSAREKVQGSIGELRQLGRGLHPAILEDRGIDAALSAVVAGSPIPISVHVDPNLDLSTDVAETLYFVVNEALANVLKHAKAKVASIHVVKVGDRVRVTVHDDGGGGIDPSKGTGIAGIRARVNAVDGLLTLTSPPGGPTTMIVEVPRRNRGDERD
jgi:signal transduction histidine kinase